MESLQAFAAELNLKAATLVGLGAFSEAVIAFFDREVNDYLEIPVNEQVEILNITGNIARFGDEPRLHAHVTLGRRDGSVLGGHLISGSVWPTLEITLTEASGRMERLLDEETGLPLLRP